MTSPGASPPRATMRLQLHRGFTFADAAGLVPYLSAMGISHLYASPILAARAGSMHGYDVIDPTRVNPELGGEADLRHLVANLRGAGLGLIVDIVPNHMAVGGDDNAWWTDVLRHGRASRYAAYFDIDWDAADPALTNKLLMPFLGSSYGATLAAGDIRVDPGRGIRCYNTLYPVRPEDDGIIADPPPERFNPGTAEGRAALHALLERQHYRLAWWGTAGDEINWRRFFDINGLAGLRIEQDEVFEATHATLFRLYAEGLIDGFRVDHVDGLSDPPGYCRRLRARLATLAARRPPDAPSGPAYLVVEKILGRSEALADDWDVDGTSGYDFMDAVNALQHDPAAAAALGATWAAVSGRPADFSVEEVAARREIVSRSFDAQLAATAAALHRIARADLATRDISLASIRRGLAALLAHFPVYRSYGAGARRRPADDAAFDRALTAAKADSPAELHPVLDWLDRRLGREAGEAVPATRFQQLSAPVAAKAVEDTTFYRYGRLLSRNDVGFDVARLGCDADAFHAHCLARQQHFPAAMLATATHDHKRGEDVRARLAVLSELPTEWEALLRRWLTRNARHRRTAGPAPGDEAMLYQTLIGAWPLQDDASRAGLQERFAGWFEKALREAKLHTSWMAPNAAYEAAARDFLASLLGDDGYIAELAGFVDRIAPAGAVNGLAQTVLKLTVPGVPDFFQGSERWDFSLVDPDNRRPVDFADRIGALSARKDLATLLRDWRDGEIKQAIIRRLLLHRQAHPALFAQGDYQPLTPSGQQAAHIVAFTRAWRGATLVVAVPRLVSSLLPGDGRLTPLREAWGDTRLPLPKLPAEARLRDVLTGRECVAAEPLSVAALLADLPVAVLHGVA